jgi:uncharacterized protein
MSTNGSQATTTQAFMADRSFPTQCIAGGNLMAYATRLKPGADLVTSIETFASQAIEAVTATTVESTETSYSTPLRKSSACFILSAVGSLQGLTLRMANASRINVADNDANDTEINNLKTWNQRLEVVSLVGTLSLTGKHLHISVSDEHGNVFGGHVMSGTVYTTLELVLGVIPRVDFMREMDASTGYRELVIFQPTNQQEDM